MGAEAQTRSRREKWPDEVEASADQILEALRKITGADPGTTLADWQRWWKENKDRFKEV